MDKNVSLSRSLAQMLVALYSSCIEIRLGQIEYGFWL